MKKCTRLIAVALVVTVLSLFGNTDNVQAANYYSKYAWRDDAGNICFTTYDKKATATYRYKTVGITVARCILGSKERSPAHEYITIPFNADYGELYYEDMGSGMIRTTFVVPEGKFLERIAAYYPAWLAELQSGDVCYLVLDSVMVCTLNKDGTEVQYGVLVDDGTRTARFFRNTYWNTPDNYCTDCGGTLPNFKEGWMDDSVISDTPICGLHPGVKDGVALEF